jgi:hypothetical protein
MDGKEHEAIVLRLCQVGGQGGGTRVSPSLSLAGRYRVEHRPSRCR